MTYPLEYRQKIIETQNKKDLTFQETSELFGISIRTLFRWHNRVEPCKTRRPYTQKIDLEVLRKDVELYPDDYQRERAVRLGVSQNAICNALKRLNITYKKNTPSPKGKRRSQSPLSTEDNRI